MKLYLVEYIHHYIEGGGPHEILGVFSSLFNADHAIEVFIYKHYPNIKIKMFEDEENIEYRFDNEEYQAVTINVINLDKELAE